MPDLIPDQLFRYLPAHRVLICLRCQYAVQPGAIARYLKEIHRIHRARRRPFLEYVSRFQLAALEDVVLPDATQFPVPFLPVQDGFACRFDDGGLDISASWRSA